MKIKTKIRSLVSLLLIAVLILCGGYVHAEEPEGEDVNTDTGNYQVFSCNSNQDAYDLGGNCNPYNIRIYKDSSYASSVQRPQFYGVNIAGNRVPFYCIDHSTAISNGNIITEYSNVWNSISNPVQNVILHATDGHGAGVKYGYSSYDILQANGVASLPTTPSYESSRMYLETQLAIWTLLYNNGYTNLGISMDGLVATCNNSGLSLSSVQAIMEYALNHNRMPSFLADTTSSAPVFTLTYNDATDKYETILTDNNKMLTATQSRYAAQGNSQYGMCQSYMTWTTSNPAVTVEATSDHTIKIVSTDATLSSPVTITGTKNTAGANNDFTVLGGNNYQSCIVTSNSITPTVGYVKVKTELADKKWVSITKEDAETGHVIGNVGFKIYDDADCTNKVAEGETDGKGILLLELEPGTYYVVETSCPENYVLDPTPKKVELTTEEITYITIKNHQKATFTISKTDGVSGEAVPGAKYGLYSDEACNSLVTDMLTGDDGKISVKVPAGTYYAKEIEAPENYYIDDTVHKITLEAAKSTILDTTDAPKGHIVIHKLGDMVTGATKYSTVYGDYYRLNFNKGNYKGVEFTIYDGDNNVVDVITTDTYGEAISKDMPVGTYKVKETKTPLGLAAIKEPFDVTISDSGEAVGEYDKYVGSASVNNDAVSAQINVYKEGEILDIENGTYSFGKKPLEGVVFGVYTAKDICDKDNNTVINKDSCIGYIVTNSDGKASLKDSLLAGSYYYKEVKTLPEYVIDNNRYDFNITLGNEVTEVIEVNKNNPLVNRYKTSDVKICKVDVSNEDILLPGCGIIIKDVHGEQIYKGYTGEDGYIYLSNLPYGKYTYQEFEAPEGYNLDTTPVEFEVVNDHEIIKGELADKIVEGNVNLTKIKSYDTTKTIKGVEFELYKVPGKTKTDFELQQEQYLSNNTETLNIRGRQNNIDLYCGTYTTDDNGKISIDKLPYGSYYFVEVKTTKAFYLSSTPSEFKIEKENQTVNIDIVNEAKIGHVKVFNNTKNTQGIKTGDSFNTFLFLSGLVMSSLVFIGVYKKKYR